MRRRTRNGRGKVRFNKNLIIDTIGASLIVQKVPALIQKFTGADLTTGLIGNVSGAGAGYLAGMFLKRPDISNVSIALAVSDMVSGVVDSVIGGVSTPAPVTTTKPSKNISDYLTLSEYTNDPSMRMGFPQYSNFYK